LFLKLGDNKICCLDRAFFYHGGVTVGFNGDPWGQLDIIRKIWTGDQQSLYTILLQKLLNSFFFQNNDYVIDTIIKI
ncbi:hypothetical protein ACJX0J_040095, partial [Zea mays]